MIDQMAQHPTLPDDARSPELEYEQVAALSLPDSAAARIARRINSGEIAPGRRLSAERVLAAELDVSRPALREALQALQAAGLVQSRRGSGWYVTEHTTDAGALALASWMQLQPIGDVVSVRRLLEPQAIRSIPATQIETIEADCVQLMTDMRRAVRRGDFDVAARLHSRFHRALVQHAPTRLMRTLLASMIDAVENAQRTIFSTPRAGMHSLERHQSILNALKKGDVEATAREVESHLEPAFTYPIRRRSREAMSEH
jgi:GntR family transcriptional repressor for pyruvate dehydrogenase complex